MRRDNRGLSLLELVVAIAVLGMVSAILVGFMSTGSTMFKQVSNDVSLQMQSQLLSTQLTEYIIDCNTSITFEGLPKTPTPTLTVDDIHAFVWDPSSGDMKYNGDEMAEYVSHFDVIFEGNTVTFRLALAKGDDVYESTHTVALRNDSARPPATPDAP